MRIDYVQPAKSNQNAYIERFNRSYRDVVLDRHIFSTISQVRDTGGLGCSATKKNALLTEAWEKSGRPNSDAGI